MSNATAAQQGTMSPPAVINDEDRSYLEQVGALRDLDSAVRYLVSSKPRNVAEGLAAFAESQRLRSRATALVGSANDLSTSNAWSELEKEYFASSAVQISTLLAEEPDRLVNFAVDVPLSEECDTGSNMVYLDASKSHLTLRVRDLLLQLLRSVNFESARDNMFSGAAINATEGRSVLHTALRNVTPGAVVRDSTGVDVMPEVRQVQEKMKDFTERVRSGAWKGHTGKPVRFIVNIGIGGSDLGPVMATEALRPYGRCDDLECIFVSNVDGTHIAEALRRIDIEQTLFIVASKTFTTVETLRNATTARDALVAHYGPGNKSAVAKHFVAVSTNSVKVREFGIDTANMFGFWDWVGGRYSVWSAIGLSLALFIGWENFHEMLTGAHIMDNHFRTAKLEANLPVLMAITALYYNNLVGCQTHAVLPYSQYLHRLPAYLQQLDMESNGKSAVIGKPSTAADVHTGPVIFGEPGTNGQHAFYQLLHQGTRVVPCDFIGTLESHNPVAENAHHRMLMANMFAQAEALMKGKTSAEARAELSKDKNAADEQLAAHKAFPGNRPSNTIILRKLTPRAFGALVAAYEHKVFTMGIVWGINSFDQFGVELGKTLANGILKELLPGAAGQGHDASTNRLITLFNAGGSSPQAAS